MDGLQMDGEHDDLPPVSIEDRAKAMGWKPVEEYRGDPRRHVGAQEFIDKGDADLPILRDQNRRMSEKIARFEGIVSELRNTVAEQTEAVRSAMTLARRADDAGYQRGISELKAKQREAVEVGDTAAFDQISEQIEVAQTERAKDAGNITVPLPKAAPVAPAHAPGQDDPETVAFKAANPWFGSKPVLRNAMIAAHIAIVEREGQQTGEDLADQYERAKTEVAESFPHFFPNEALSNGHDPEPQGQPAPRPRLRAPALSPQNGPAGRRDASPFSRIADPRDRAEAEAAYANIRKYDPDQTPDEYVKLYLGEANVLDLRAARKKG